MKRVVFVFFCLVSLCTKAQDFIVPFNGTPIKAYNIELGDKYLYYQLENNTNALIQKIERDAVLLIRKSDGRVVDLASGNVQTKDIYDIEKSSFSTIPNESIKGLIFAKGNKVFVPTDSEFLYEKAGQEETKRLLTQWGYWVVVDKPEQAHFVLQFKTRTEGRDMSYDIIRTRMSYANNPSLPCINFWNGFGSDSGVIFGWSYSSEEIDENKAVAYSIFCDLKKRVECVKADGTYDGPSSRLESKKLTKSIKEFLILK